MATAEEYINSMYDNKRKSTIAGLESTYNQNVNKLNAEAEKIPQTFYDARRTAAGNEGIAKLNMNETFAANGLNTGAVGQANLARNRVASQNMAGIMQAEADAKADVAQQRADLESAYRNNVQQAISDSDFSKANAMFTEYKENRDLARNQVDKLLSAGVMPSANLIAQSGYSNDYVSRLYAAMVG